MRFACPQCGKRYVVNDQVLPDRVYRLRCKACGTIMPIRANGTPGSEGSEAPAPGAAIPLPSGSRGGSTATPPAIPVPRQPALPAAVSPRQAMPAPQAPAEAPRYVDLFADEDLGALALDPATSPGAASATAPTPARPPLASEPDPFARVNAAFAQPESRPPPPPATPASPQGPTREPANTQRKRLGAPLAIGLAAASGVVLTLLAVSLFRSPAPVAPSPAPAPPAVASPQPKPARPVPAAAKPADDAGAPPARLEEQKQAQAEKLEKERQAREEKDRLAREEKDRKAREEKDRKAREEKERLAREEKERLKAEKAEKERARREKLAQAKAAKAEPAAPPAATQLPPEPAKAAAPSGGSLLAVEFSGTRSTRRGGDVSDTVYSQNSGDAKITGKSFANGLLTFTGQVGYGGGSTYAGIGLNVNIHPDGKPMDASGFTSMTIRLAGDGVRTLRIRLIGSESGTRSNGCYPIAVQRVSEDAKEYVVRLSEFVPEGWCGSKGRDAARTLSELVGFEIADVTIDPNPVSFSVGSIRLNP